MKKINYSFLTCLVLFSMKVQAQQGLHAGIEFQPSLQTMRSAWLSSSGDNYDPDFNQTLRSSFGIHLDYHFNPYVGFGADILYSAQGQKFLVVNDSGKYESHFYKFNFIKIPVFLSYNSAGDKVRLIGDIGPQVLVLVGAKDVYSSKEHDIKDSYAPLNLGFHFGLGLGFFLTRNAMVTIAPNFDIAFLNYNYTTEFAEKAYLGKSPVITTFGIKLGVKYVKNEIAASEETIKNY